MDLEDAWADATVATGVAVCTIAVTLILEYVFAVEANALLRISPLSVYFIYLFTHQWLPEGLDQPWSWIALTVAVSVGVLGVAVGP